jgi:hypothetical protein
MMGISATSADTHTHCLRVVVLRPDFLHCLDLLIYAEGNPPERPEASRQFFKQPCHPVPDAVTQSCSVIVKLVLPIVAISGKVDYRNGVS